MASEYDESDYYFNKFIKTRTRKSDTDEVDIRASKENNVSV